MYFKSFFYFLALCTFLSCGNSKKELLTDKEKQWLKQKGAIKVSTYGNYPPYQFVNTKGEMDGIFIDYIKLIEKKIDANFTYINYNKWSNVLNDAKNNKIDLISEIQETKERSNYLHFYSRLFDGQFVITTRKKILKPLLSQVLLLKKL